MELLYKPEHKDYFIASILCSKDKLEVISEVPEKFQYSIETLVYADKPEECMAIQLIGCFCDEKKEPFTNELKMQIKFKFRKSIPMSKSKDGKLNLSDINALISMLDTAVGTYRGILFTWLEDTQFSRPLPLMDITQLAKDAKFTFID